MKKLIFLLLLLPMFSFSQVDSNKVIQQETPNQINKPQIKNELISTNFSDSREYYCDLVGTEKLLSKKVTVEIDFGEHRKYFEDARLKDENGNLIVFNSMIDALNFMGGLGWKLHSTMLISEQYSRVYHFVLVKIAPKE